MTDKEKKLRCIEIICDSEMPYTTKLSAYEFLCANGEEVVSEMLESVYKTDGDNAQMFVEILANFKGRKDVYLLLVTYLYRAEDIALFAKLLGSYGDERAIEVLNSFAQENELNYNDYMEVRNAVEQLGGVFSGNQDFSQDPFYKFLKGLDDGEVLENGISDTCDYEYLDDDNIDCEDLDDDTDCEDLDDDTDCEDLDDDTDLKI